MIKNIIFDLGNVLVKVDLNKFKKGIIAGGVDGKTYDAFLKSDDFFKLIYKYETGAIGSNYFVSSCIKKLGSAITKTSFIGHFNDMLVEKKEMKGFIEKLTSDSDYNFLLLSNTNPLHWAMRKNFPYILRLRNFCLSYKIKLYKPDIRVYKYVLKKYKFKPSETIYIDDHENNCLSASSLGIKTILYKDFARFKKEIKKYTNSK